MGSAELVLELDPLARLGEKLPGRHVPGPYPSFEQLPQEPPIAPGPSPAAVGSPVFKDHVPINIEPVAGYDRQIDIRGRVEGQISLGGLEAETEAPRPDQYHRRRVQVEMVGNLVPELVVYSPRQYR